MIFCDQAKSFRQLASLSADDGDTWSTPELTNMQDSRSKQCSGNFPDGTAFIVINPNKNHNSFPLVITLSTDANKFDETCLL